MGRSYVKSVLLCGENVKAMADVTGMLLAELELDDEEGTSCTLPYQYISNRSPPWFKASDEQQGGRPCTDLPFSA